MASDFGFIEYLCDQLQGAGTITYRKMFGEYAIYCNEKVVALVCDDELFVKPTSAGKAFIGDVMEGCPYPGAKPYFLISGDQWEDSEWLSAYSDRNDHRFQSASDH